MSRSKCWAGASLLLAGLLLVLACAPATAPPTATRAEAPAATKPADAPKAADPAAAGANKITLKFLTSGGPEALRAWRALGDEFNKRNPHITVEIELAATGLVQKIQAATAAKTPYDIIYADGPLVWNFAYNGAIAPLDEWFDKEYIQSQWLPSSLVTAYYRGKFYGPAERESCSVLWYNQDLTDKAGIQPPRAFGQSWTIDEALTAWQKLNDPPNVYALQWGHVPGGGNDYDKGLLYRSAASSKESPAFKAIADDRVTVTGYFDHPEAIKGHQFLHDIYHKYKLSPVEQIPEGWQSRKVAMFLSPDSAVAVYNRLYPGGNGGFKYGATGIPYFKGGVQLCHNDSNHLTLGAFSQHKAEAAAYIKFATSAEGSRIYYEYLPQLPSNVALLNTLPAYQGFPGNVVLDSFKQVGTARVTTPGFAEFLAISIEFYQSVVQTQDADVKQLATTAAQRATAQMAKYKDWQSK